MVAELGGAQREAGVGGGGGHVRVWRRERGLELVGVVVGVAGLVVRVDGGGGEEPVRVGDRVSGVVADTQGDLVHYSAALWVGETVAVLEEGGRARGQDGVWVVNVGRVGQQGVCVRGGRGVCGAAVLQVCEGVCVHRGGDVGVRSQRTIVAVPLFVAEVGNVRHLSKAQRVLLLVPTHVLLPGKEGGGWEEGVGGGSALSYEAAAPFGAGPGLCSLSALLCPVTVVVLHSHWGNHHGPDAAGAPALHCRGRQWCDHGSQRWAVVVVTVV